jgi:hypothetical protein
MAKNVESLLQLTPDQYLALSDAQSTAIVKLANDRHQRQYWYASLGMLCGTVTFVICIYAYEHFVDGGHPREAKYVLGAAILGMITRILTARL